MAEKSKIRFHSKGECVLDCLYSKALIRGQVRADYNYFLDHHREGHYTNTYNLNQKRVRLGQSSYSDGWPQQQHGHREHEHSYSRQWVNIRGQGHGNGIHNEYRSGNGSECRDQWNPSNSSHPQDRQRQKCGQQTHQNGVRSVYMMASGETYEGIWREIVEWRDRKGGVQSERI